MLERRIAAALLTASALAASATAQFTNPQPDLQIPPDVAQVLFGTPPSPQLAGGNRRAILLTGYWPPSNEAVRRFSPSATQNPQGWLGSDWEGRGYDVYAYFPEFSPPNCTSCGTGSGDLTVDYQDTSADFWPIADALQPIAIITFSRTSSALRWELETNQYNRTTWGNDYVVPLQPTPAPPDASVPAGTLRPSTLPMQEIVDDVLDANLGLNAFICVANHAGAFLSEFIAYHGVWYQALHSSPADPAWCITAGHVHVGSGVTWPTAQRAAEVTLRTVIRHVDAVRFGSCHDADVYCRTTSNSVGQGAMLTSLGSTSIAGNDLDFALVYAPANASSILFYGAGAMQAPFGNGQMCVTAPRTRVPPLFTTDANGFAARDVDLSIAPLGAGASAVSAGTTWRFQVQYRDTAAGGATFNMSSALALTFCP